MGDTGPISQENVELIRRGFMAAMEEDWPTALDTLHADAEIHDFAIPDADDQGLAMEAVGLRD